MKKLKIMKNLLMTILVCLSANLFAQEERTTKITVSGQGKTLDDARQSALRSAIEQAFGAFISSKTEVLNDNLVKDEIVSIANGNIQKYSILSEVEIPNIGYATTLEAIVSINKLTKFCESKGIQVEFAGSLFGANMKQQKLNEEAETKAIINLCETSKEILKKALDFEVAPSEPKNVGVDKFEISYNVSIKPNENYKKWGEYFKETMSGISMSVTEKNNYIGINKPFYTIAICDTNSAINRTEGPKNELKILLRSDRSIIALLNFLHYSCSFAYNFRIETNIDSFFPDYKVKMSSKNDDWVKNKIKYFYKETGNVQYNIPSIFSVLMYDSRDFKNNAKLYNYSVTPWNDGYKYSFFTIDSSDLFVFLTKPENYYSFSQGKYFNECSKKDQSFRDSCNCQPEDVGSQFKNYYPGVMFSGKLSDELKKYDQLYTPRTWEGETWESVKQFGISLKIPVQGFSIKKQYSVAEIEKISKVSIVSLNNQP